MSRRSSLVVPVPVSQTTSREIRVLNREEPSNYPHLEKCPVEIFRKIVEFIPVEGAPSTTRSLMETCSTIAHQIHEDFTSTNFSDMRISFTENGCNNLLSVLESPDFGSYINQVSIRCDLAGYYFTSDEAEMARLHMGVTSVPFRSQRLLFCAFQKLRRLK
ncbi:hypothetical protein EJ08DRAFT_197415 [Tothia fuscella]|uniref:Uncharacterized protein n=1 Tax=Tothia fuscella TaxID=1048955 RepID=A0A9P4TZ66_9PEZI|nr:hypothetical protein EJ08DRAFT_197415 [Tothia fuscella]